MLFYLFYSISGKMNMVYNIYYKGVCNLLFFNGLCRIFGKT